MENDRKTCCFIGHRKVADKDQTRAELVKVIENLISDNFMYFLFGDEGEFSRLCQSVLEEEKIKHSHIKRVFVRGKFPDINEEYENYLLENCEETYFPEKALNAGRAIYIERNCEMIDKSDVCVFYYIKTDEKSGTKMAFDYANRKNKRIINL